MHLCKHNKAWMCTKLMEMAVFIVTFHPAILQKLRNTKKYKIPRCCWLGLQTVKFSDLLIVLGKVNRTSSISRDPAQQLAGLKWFVFPDETRGVLSMPWWVRLFLASQRRQFKKKSPKNIGQQFLHSDVTNSQLSQILIGVLIWFRREVLFHTGSSKIEELFCPLINEIMLSKLHFVFIQVMFS